MNMFGVLCRGLGIIVLAAGSSPASAIAQLSYEPPMIVAVPATRHIADALRRLPPLDGPSASIATRAESGTWFPGVADSCRTSAPASWETSGVIQGVDIEEEVLEPPSDRWRDEKGELIQIAPDPPDPWAGDPFDRYSYNGSGNPHSLHWIPGSRDRMGILTIPFTSFKEPEEGKNSFSLEATWHLIGGPRRTDMPPHLWDLAARLGRRNRLDSFWAYDIAIRPGWFSDFEGSARKGLRFPAHGVLYYTPSDSFQLQVGLDYLDRDDIACLPVFGAVFKPHRNLRLDAVFPKPRIAYGIEGQGWLYVTGEMDGGTWAIKRADGANDVATYRDYRICLGVERHERSVTEIGLVLDRHLEYRSGTPSFTPLTTTILRHAFCY